MAFGFKVADSSGTTVYDTTSITWNQVDIFTVARNGSTTKSYSYISGLEKLAVQLFIDPPLTDRKAVAHTVSWSGTTLSISGGSEDVLIVVLAR